MFKKTIPVAAAVVLALSAGAAVADPSFEPANNEAGVIMHYVPGTKTRAQVETERIEALRNPVTADGWRYVGDESGWQLVQHDYVLSNDVLAHSDKCDHRVTPKPSLASITQGRQQYQDLYAGG